MQIDRLLEIVMILLSKRRATAKELSGRLGVSPRTIYRDIDALSVAGIPVFSTKGNGGGIGLLEGFTMDRSLLTDKEKKDIVFALQSLRAAHFPDLEQTLCKLRGLFQSGAQENWIEVDFSPWGSMREEKERFALLKDAILQKQAVSFDYISSAGVPSSRVAEPLRLGYKGQSWYLQAYCREKQDFRVFRISRMHDLRPLGETFDRSLPDDFKLDFQPVDPSRYVSLKLKFSPSLAHRVYDDFAAGLITRDGEGNLLVTARYIFDEWVIGYLLSFGGAVEVLEPSFVRELIKSRAEEIMSKY